MTRSASENSGSSVPRNRRSLSNLGAFIFGVPLGIAILAFLLELPEESPARRYAHHPVERVEIILFSCALGALLGKVLGQWGERRAFRQGLLPEWDGVAVPTTEADGLRTGLCGLRRGLQKTYLARRIAGVLDFVHNRGSANELDDQVRALSDSDAVSLEASYSFLRLVIWAIPILGFLGTVLGITGAISGVTPEVLEKSLGTVTDGLALAFDTTALALGLTMILMFLNSMVERIEQATLERVDQFIDEHLAHRFERTGSQGSDPAQALSSQALIKATEHLVERQAAVWARSMEKGERLWTEAGQRQQQQLVAALEDALTRAQDSHNQRLAELEQKTVEQSKALFNGLTALATVLRDTGREFKAGLTEIAQQIGAQANVLGRLQEGEAHLVRLQESLQQNLTALAGAGSFDQAVQSLTAAIHMLTARANTGVAAFPRKAA